MGCEDVCIVCDFDDTCEFSTHMVVKARRLHRCCECRVMIQPGTLYERAVGKWEDILTFRTCLLCVEIRNKFSCDGEFVYGDLWDSMYEEVFPDLGFKCLEGLSAAAKEVVLKKWASWKGVQGGEAREA